MRTLLLIIILFFFHTGLFAADTLHVVVIGVDGLSSWSVNKYNTPVMDSLMKCGSYTLKAKAVYPTLSCPNWASMTMGVKPKSHGIMSNHWEWKDREGKNTPTVFRIIKEQHSDLSISVYHHWKEFGDLVEKDFITTSQHTQNESLTIQISRKYLVNNKPDFTFIHLDHVDSCGHHFGHRSMEYQKAVEKTDSLVGAFLSYINDSPLKGKVLLIVTSDHGFWGKHHGGFFRKEKNIPWIIAGPGVRKNYKIRKRVNTYDTAATIAYLFSVQAPLFWDGKVVKEVFGK